MSDFLIHNKGFFYLFRFLLISFLALFAYGAAAVFFGIVFKNPAIPGFILLVWEMTIAYLPGALKPYSIAHYLQSLMPLDVPRMKFFAILAKPVSLFTSVSMPLAIGAVFIGLSFYFLNKKAPHGQTPPLTLIFFSTDHTGPFCLMKSLVFRETVFR